MAGLPKAYFKRFPGKLKQAWAAYRKEKGGGASKKKAAHKKRRRARTVKASGVPARKHKHGGVKMAKRRRKSRTVKHKVRRAGRRASVAMATKPIQMLTMAATAAAGGVATSFIVNKTPKIKEMSQGTKSAIQGGLGLAAIFFGKKKWIKSLGAGSVIASVFGLSKAILKLDPLAGPGSGRPTLSPSQVQRLIRTGSMGVPANVRAPGMGLPASVRMGGNSSVIPSRSGGWGGVSF